ncbi:putative F-box protein At1g32420 [Lycium ferocissimum]|uniref:putative F-box protein At1g32420 n=1 Tax=Lycium ferocissimum TaxID=112874 RepID=UPI002816192D|nr:putative F-box protein At1g32420 [Lycium ferocissimum]
MNISKRKKKKEDHDEEQHIISCNIPDDMVIEILRRVPCQDLLENLTLVCKKWYTIINNGSFAYSHLEHTIKKSISFSQLKALVISTSDGKSVTVSSLEWNNNFKDQPFGNLRSKPIDLFTIEYVSGTGIYQMLFQKANCLNGFVCFWSGHHARFHIYNSMTMEYITTPPNPYWRQDTRTITGLGFCPISYEYKVVVVQRQFQFGKPPSKQGVNGSISTVNGYDQSWRSLKWNHSSLGPDGWSTACVNGILYWCTKSIHHDPHHHKVKSDTTTLVAFDVAKEEFDLIEVPIESLEDNVSIEEKAGKICLVTKTMCLNFSSILFKGYIAHNNDDLGSLNSWMLEFSVTIYDHIYDGIEGVCHMIFTNEILIVDAGETMSFFDVETGKLLNEFQRSGLQASMLIPYVPSLVALHHYPIREKIT